MKKTLFAICIGILSLAAAACQESLSEDRSGTLSVVVYDAASLETRASDVTELGYERQLNNLQLFVFEGSTLLKYEQITDGLSGGTLTRSYESIKAGAYHVYAVANAADLSGVSTEEDLLETAVWLSECRLDASTGFVMAGDGQTVVGSGSAATVSVPLTRFAARVRLVSLTNEVPASYAGGGQVKIEAVYLANALGTWNLGGTGTASQWVNLGGRAAGKEASSNAADMIAASAQVNPAAYASQVFRGQDISVSRGSVQTFTDCCLYSFPNAVTEDHTGNTATQTAGALTRLVVQAQVNGARWWYPVTLFQDGKGIERNTTYDVRLTLRATGSDDPNEPVGKGMLTATVSTAVWLQGAEYTETI